MSPLAESQPPWVHALHGSGPMCGAKGYLTSCTIYRESVTCPGCLASFGRTPAVVPPKLTSFSLIQPGDGCAPMEVRDYLEVVCSNLGIPLEVMKGPDWTFKGKDVTFSIGGTPFVKQDLCSELAALEKEVGISPPVQPNDSPVNHPRVQEVVRLCRADIALIRQGKHPGGMGIALARNVLRALGLDP